MKKDENIEKAKEIFYIYLKKKKLLSTISEITFKTLGFVLGCIFAVGFFASKSDFSISYPIHTIVIVSYAIILMPYILFVILIALATKIILFNLPNNIDFQGDAPEDNSLNVVLQEPLHEVTRKARRNLLLASLIGCIMTLGGFVPSKIEALGIESNDLNNENIITIAFVVVLYFFIAFSIYIRNDVVNYVIKSPFMDSEVRNNTIYRMRFEVGLPIVFGAFSLALLFQSMGVLFRV